MFRERESDKKMNKYETVMHYEKVANVINCDYNDKTALVENFLLSSQFSKLLKFSSETEKNLSHIMKEVLMPNIAVMTLLCLLKCHISLFSKFCFKKTGYQTHSRIQFSSTISF
jgi:hypothetical protein